jgi:hypothetical protein
VTAHGYDAPNLLAESIRQATRLGMPGAHHTPLTTQTHMNGVLLPRPVRRPQAPLLAPMQNPGPNTLVPAPSSVPPQFNLPQLPAATTAPPPPINLPAATPNPTTNTTTNVGGASQGATRPPAVNDLDPSPFVTPASGLCG